MRIEFCTMDRSHPFEEVLAKIRSKELQNVSVSFNKGHTTGNDNDNNIRYEIQADINELVVLKALGLR